MSWSLLGDPVERGARALATRLWPAANWQTGSCYVFVGYFKCRPYHNLSAFCHMAREIPALSPADVTFSYFEDVAPPKLPRGLQAPLRLRLLAVPQLMGELTSLRPRLTELDGQLAELESNMRAAVSAGSTLALGACFSRARQTLDRAWALHYSTTLALVPLWAMQRGVARRVLPNWGEIASWLNRPPELVWEPLSELRAIEGPNKPAAFLDHAFYEIADGLEPWRDYAARPRTTAGEAPSRQNWLDPSRVVWDIEGGGKATLLPQLTRLVGDTMACREASKSLAMRCMHVFRDLVPRVSEEAGLDASAWPYLTIGELADAHLHRDLGARSERRRAQCEEALRTEAPDELRFDEQSSSAPAAARRLPRTARGISPGRVTGVVVYMAGATDTCNAPKILVCDAADADVQPLLPLVAGVLTTRGSALSHIAIIVREYGIPAVVGHPLAGELMPGQWVSIDGSRGEVTIIGS